MSADLVRAHLIGEGLVRVLDLMAETYPHPDGRTVRISVSLADGGAVIGHVDIDVESVTFLASRSAESVARGQARIRRNAFRLVQGEAR